MKQSIPFVILLALTPFAAWSEDKNLINVELKDALDFRTVNYAKCESKPTCTVGAVTITAQRRILETAPWKEAMIYWDPIDGLGVQDGAQNDEIDFDERLTITFDREFSLQKIWITDLFLEEDGRYATERSDGVADVIQNVEVAGYELVRNGETFSINEIEGKTEMPWQSFNMRIMGGLIEDGDLRRRVIIREDKAVLIVPDPTNTTRTIELTMPVDKIDEEKLAIFEGTDTVEIDITEILAEFDDSPLFEQGTHNFKRLQSLLDKPEKLEELYEKAKSMRTISSLSNGELGIRLESPQVMDGINFYAPFNSSNDFSVAGLILVEN